MALIFVVFFLAAAFRFGSLLLSRVQSNLSKITYFFSSLLLGVTLLADVIFIFSYIFPFSQLQIILITTLIACAVEVFRLALKLKDKPNISISPKKTKAHDFFTKENSVIVSAFGLIVFMFAFLWQKMLVFENGNLIAGWVNIWGDWAAHLSYVSSFAYGNNFPPEMPILAGYPFSYTFFADFLSAVFIKLGFDLIPAMLWPSFVLSIVFCLLFFDIARQILKSKLQAMAALFIFLLNGGLGFYYFFFDAKKGLKAMWQNLPQEYTHLDKIANIQFINHITAEFIPQRSFLLGICLSLLAFFLLTQYLKQKKPVFVYLAALIAGSLPLIHLHSFLAVNIVALCVCLSSLNKKNLKDWMIYGVIVSVLFLPQFYTFFPQIRHSQYPKWQPGWLSYKSNDNILWFWFKNAGISLLLAVFGFIVAPKKLKLTSLPFWGFFIIPNLFLLHPYEWDNTKFLTFWSLGVSLLCAAGLSFIWNKKILGKTLAVLLFSLAIFSGALDVLRLSQYNQRKIHFLSANDVAVSEWIRTNTPADSIFLTAGNHDHPVPMLSGRKIALGFEGWLWTYGIDYGKRKQAVENWLKNPTISKLQNLNINYVFFGRLEQVSPFKNNAAWMNKNLVPVFKKDGAIIYKVPS